MFYLGHGLQSRQICSLITARKRSLEQGNMFTGVCLSTGGCLVPGGLVRGVPGPGGGACSRRGGVAWWRHPRAATAAGSTHPTGMHSRI